MIETSYGLNVKTQVGCLKIGCHVELQSWPEFFFILQVITIKWTVVEIIGVRPPPGLTASESSVFKKDDIKIDRNDGSQGVERPNHGLVLNPNTGNQFSCL